MFIPRKKMCRKILPEKLLFPPIINNQFRDTSAVAAPSSHFFGPLQLFVAPLLRGHLELQSEWPTSLEGLSSVKYDWKILMFLANTVDVDGRQLVFPGGCSDHIP